MRALYFKVADFSAGLYFISDGIAKTKLAILAFLCFWGVCEKPY